MPKPDPIAPSEVEQSGNGMETTLTRNVAGTVAASDFFKGKNSIIKEKGYIGADQCLNRWSRRSHTYSDILKIEKESEDAAPLT